MNEEYQPGDRVSVHAEYCGYDGEQGTVRGTYESSVFVDLDEDERSHAGTAFATSEVKLLSDKA